MQQGGDRFDEQDPKSTAPNQRQKPSKGRVRHRLLPFLIWVHTRIMKSSTAAPRAQLPDEVHHPRANLHPLMMAAPAPGVALEGPMNRKTLGDMLAEWEKQTNALTLAKV